MYCNVEHCIQKIFHCRSFYFLFDIDSVHTFQYMSNYIAKMQWRRKLRDGNSQNTLVNKTSLCLDIVNKIISTITLFAICGMKSITQGKMYWKKVSLKMLKLNAPRTLQYERYFEKIFRKWAVHFIQTLRWGLIKVKFHKWRAEFFMFHKLFRS